MPFCTNCGKELKEGETCGCKQEAPKTEEVKKEVKVKAEKEAKPEKKKRVLPIVIIVAVLVLAAIVGILVLTSKSYLKPIDRYVALVNEKTLDYREYQYALMADSRAKASRKFAEAKMAETSYQNMVEDSEDIWEAYFDRCDDEMENWTFTYEVKSKEKLDEDELKDLQRSCERHFRDNLEDQIEDIQDILDDKGDLEDAADDADIEVSEMKAIYKAQLAMLKNKEKVEITNGYEVKIKFVVETEDERYKTENVKVRIVKMNGDWVYAGTTETVRFDEDMLYFISNNFNNSYLNY